MNLRIASAFAVAGVALLATPVAAAERGYSVVGFDKIKLEGPFTVIVGTGRSGSARASGSSAAIERISVTVQSGTLVIKPYKSGWGGWPGADAGPVTVRVTTPTLISAALTGSGQLNIDKIRAARLGLFLAGSGQLTVGSVMSDRLTLVQSGSGEVSVAGTSLLADISMNGSGSLKTDTLSIGDLKLVARSSGTVVIAARRSAKVDASGSGSVKVTGNPACSGSNVGSGTVECGRN